MRYYENYLSYVSYVLRWDELVDEMGRILNLRMIADDCSDIESAWKRLTRTDPNRPEVCVELCARIDLRRWCMADGGAATHQWQTFGCQRCGNSASPKRRHLIILIRPGRPYPCLMKRRRNALNASLFHVTFIFFFGIWISHTLSMMFRYSEKLSPTGIQSSASK